jgi:phosphoglycolate phosphatase-like HAD superfamily hydrolase
MLAVHDRGAMTAADPRTILFDIDGTLITSGGPGAASIPTLEDGFPV